MVFPVRVDEQLPAVVAALAGQAEVAVFAEGLASVPEKIAALMVTDIPALEGQSAGQVRYRKKI